MRLATETRGFGRPRLAFVHGFTQTGRSWKAVAADLSVDHEVVCVDAPGHGGSSAVSVNMADGAVLLANTVGPGVYVGYSMGARLCLHVAVNRPDVVQGLVLLGANPGIEDAGERAARRTADDALAAEIERGGVEPFIERWLAQPLFADVPADAADRAERRRNTAAGLAASLRLAGSSTHDLWPELATISAPTLVLAGERDTKFTEIGRRVAATIGASATFAPVPEAGHAAHLVQPSAFVDILRGWLTTAPIMP